jgi:hypothetical protein
MELFLGGLAAFVVEVLVLALLLAPRWTLRQLARPFRALACRLRTLARRLRTRSGRQDPATSPNS